MLGQAILDDAVIMARGDDKLIEIDVAVEEMVREYSRFVFRIAYSMLRNHSDAEDAAQEVFVRVLKYKGKLAGVVDKSGWRRSPGA